MTKPKLRSNSDNFIDEMDDKLGSLFIGTVEVFRMVLDDIRSGKTAASGHALNAIVAFLDKNEALFPALRDKRSMRVNGVPYSKGQDLRDMYDKLPVFDDDEEYEKHRQ